MPETPIIGRTVEAVNPDSRDTFDGTRRRVGWSEAGPTHGPKIPSDYADFEARLVTKKLAFSTSLLRAHCGSH